MFGVTIRAAAAALLLALLLVRQPADAGPSAPGPHRSLLPIVAQGRGIGSVAQVWRWQNPRPQGSTLRAVSFAGAGLGWAVGEQGAILGTADHGATWTVQRVGQRETLLGVAAVSSRVAWAAGQAGVVLRTVDGGASWQRLAAPADDFLGVAAASAADAWLVGGQQNAVYRTTDGGATWSTASTDVRFPQAIAAVSSRELAVVGGPGAVAISADAGATWQTVYAASNWLRDVRFTPAATIWVAGDGATLVSHDRGATWSESAVGATVRVDAASPSVAWVERRDLSLLRTVDGGATWTRQSSGDVLAHQFGFVIEPPPALAAISADVAWLVGYQGGLAQTADGGATWSPRSPDSRGDRIAVSFVDQSVGWAVGGGPILATSDGGATWVEQRSPISPFDSCAFSSCLLEGVAAVSRRVAWAVGGDQAVLRTTDGGATWEQRAVDLPPGSRGALLTGYVPPERHPVAVVAVTADAAWVLFGDGRLVRTLDGGQSWRAQTPSGVKIARLLATGPTTLWAVGSRQDRGAILRTTDGGVSWLEMAYGSSGPLFDLSAPAPGVLWAAGQAEVVRTDDLGLTWRVHRPVALWGQDVRALSAADDRLAWAVGRDGILATTDGGQSWSEASAVSPLNDVEAVTSESVWAVGTGGAILRGTPD